MPEENKKPKTKSVVKSEHPQDRVGDLKTVYSVSSFEIFWRNLVAGAARALGGIMMYALFLFFLGSIFTQLIWPQLEPFVNTYTQALDTFTQTSTGNQPSEDQLQQLLKDPQMQRIIQQLQQ